MARGQRKDVDYFPHDCTHGRKMHIIETRYGNDGYAVWFKLLEQLGKANNHYIDISDEMTLMYLVSTFKIDEEKTNLILNDLAKLGAIDKFLYDNHKIIWSDKFVKSISDAYRKRTMELFTKNHILAEIDKKNSNPREIDGGLSEKQDVVVGIPVNLPESIPKEENSKEKEIIEEDILANSVFDYRKELLKLVSNKTLVNDFISLRQIKNASLSETSFRLLIDECTNNSFPIENALKISIEKNWTGFQVQWVKNLETKNNTSNGKSESAPKSRNRP